MDSYVIRIDGEILADLVRQGLLKPSDFTLLEVKFKEDEEI